MVEEKEMRNPKKDEEEEEQCDFCGEARALLYCRADTARLCLSCDRHVHRANSVSSKHPRALLCNSCSSAQSSLFCPAHAQVLCSNCDFEAHDREAHPGRRPVEAFYGCPSAADLAVALGVSGLGEEFNLLKKIDNENEFIVLGEEERSWVWETPRVVRLDDLIVPNSAASHGFQAMNVPPLPKNRNLACGKNKDEILRQLRQLIKSETHLISNNEDNQDNQQDNLNSEQLDGDQTYVNMSNFGGSEVQWNQDDWQEAADPVMFPCGEQQAASDFSAMTPSFSEGPASFLRIECPVAGGGDLAESLSPVTPRRPLELLCPDRDSVISRYKEKRKSRRYGKLIRYESRKARADTRVRIKGRFAKTKQAPNS